MTVRYGGHGPSDADDGVWLLAPGTNGGGQPGPLVLDAHGRVVWFRPLRDGYFAMNLRVQRYQGQPVLTWWEGNLAGLAEGVIVDSSYREVARVRAGNGHQIDPHEFLLTPQGTALITCSPSTVSHDLTPVGGAKDGQVYESVIQEVDVQTGQVVMEWHSLDHVAVSESYMAPGGVYDYLHVNSIDMAPDGHLLVSGRHTWALYKLHRSTGEVIWRLGGKRSDFSMGRGTRFTWQHDARHVGDGKITVFDNGAAVFNFAQQWRKSESQSRALALEVDSVRRTVRLARQFRHHPPLLTIGYGNVQTLSDGDVVIGWGNAPVFTHLTARGAPLQEITIPVAYSSYRALRQHWRGIPHRPPDLVADRDASGRSTTLYASWNGATGVSAWRVSAGAHQGDLRPVARKKRTGFETAIALTSTEGYATVTALDRAGRPLATSSAIKL
ncbi:MAG: arylsulfotransferase family protein [Solirubrobacteraceae bacterium]